METVKIIGYLLLTAALFFYVQTIRAIWQLVAEARQLGSTARFNRLWWTPAWMVHRRGYPESAARRQIVIRFLLTFSLAMAGMGCIAFSVMRDLPSDQGRKL